MTSRLRAVARRLKAKLSGEPTEITTWKQRADSLRARAVFNAGHAESELAAVTEMQKRELYPRLRQVLDGSERLALDFGCGTGRFSGDLAELISGKVVAVDPVQGLLDLAPRNENVEYRLMKAGRIPAEAASVDLAWICLVLGGIQGELLDQTLRELVRVLKPNGLVFLVENTTNASGNEFWTFRSVDRYQTILRGIRLDHLADYTDLGERISIFAGRKAAGTIEHADR